MSDGTGIVHWPLNLYEETPQPILAGNMFFIYIFTLNVIIINCVSQHVGQSDSKCGLPSAERRDSTSLSRTDRITGIVDENGSLVSNRREHALSRNPQNNIAVERNVNCHSRCDELRGRTDGSGESLHKNSHKLTITSKRRVASDAISVPPENVRGSSGDHPAQLSREHMFAGGIETTRACSGANAVESSREGVEVSTVLNSTPERERNNYHCFRSVPTSIRLGSPGHNGGSENGTDPCASVGHNERESLASNSVETFFERKNTSAQPRGSVSKTSKMNPHPDIDGMVYSTIRDDTRSETEGEIPNGARRELPEFAVDKELSPEHSEPLGSAQDSMVAMSTNQENRQSNSSRSSNGLNPETSCSRESFQSEFSRASEEPSGSRCISAGQESGKTNSGSVSVEEDDTLQDQSLRKELTSSTTHISEDIQEEPTILTDSLRNRTRKNIQEDNFIAEFQAARARAADRM